MVDVAGNNRATARDFIPYELGGDFIRNTCSKRLAGVLRGKVVGRGRLLLRTAVALGVDSGILAEGNEFHLGSNAPLPCVVELSDDVTGLSSYNLAFAAFKTVQVVFARALSSSPCGMRF